MKRYLLFFLFLPVTARADEVQLDHTFGMAQGPQSLAFSPDARRLAVAGSDGVKIYDAPTGKLLETRAASGFLTSSVAWSHDGKTLAAGGLTIDSGPRGEVVLWRTGSPELRWKTGIANIQSLDFSADGELLATAASESWAREAERGAGRVWDTTTGKLLHTLDVYAASRAATRFGPNDEIALSSYYEYDTPLQSMTRVYDVTTGRLIRRVKGVPTPIWWKGSAELWPSSVIAFQRQGDIERQVVRVSEPTKGIAHIVYVARNRRTKATLTRVELKRETNSAEETRAQIGGDLLAVVSPGKEVGVWRTRLGSSSLKLLYTFNRTLSPTQLAISGDRQTLGVATKRGVLLLDSKLKVKHLLPPGETDEDRRLFGAPLSFSRDGSRLWAGQLLQVSPATAAPVLSRELTDSTATVSLSPDGKSFVHWRTLSDGNGKEISLRVPDFGSDEPNATKSIERILRANWRSDGEKFVVTCGNNGGRSSDDGFFVFDKKGHFEHQLKLENGYVFPRDAVFSPDGALIATTGTQEHWRSEEDAQPIRRPRLDIWNADTGQWLRSMPVEAKSNVSFLPLGFFLSWSPDGKTVAASRDVLTKGRLENRILFFSTSTGQQVGTLPLSSPLFLSYLCWGFLDDRRIVLLKNGELETWDWRARKRLGRQFLVPDGDKIRAVASPN